MATKKQELEALEQIMAIVKKLGKNSYTGAALEGCLELAKYNIDNDTRCSMQKRAEWAENEYGEVLAELDAVKRERDEAVKKLQAH